MLRIERALPTDAKDIGALLDAAGLPLPKPVLSASFLLARENGASLGCIAYELFGSDALLRSHVVLTEARGRGIGSTLVSRLLMEIARQETVQAVYLLTLDATEYFSRFGFVPIPRDEVPPALLESQEFSIHACDNAACMYRRIKVKP